MKRWLDSKKKNFAQLPIDVQEQIYRDFYGLVYRNVFYLVGDHGLTEEVIQDSFLKAVSTLHKQEVSNIQEWLKTVARNTAIDQMRKSKGLALELDLPDFQWNEYGVGVELLDNEVETLAETRARNECLREAIIELKTDYRVVITLFYIYELTYKETAELLDLSEQAVSQRLARARKKLLRLFQRKWVNHHE